MNLEDQVAPLALAQRMKELGFPQDTAFSWYVRRDAAGAVIEDGHPRLRLSDGAQVADGAYDIPPGYEGSHIRREQMLVKWESRCECAAPTVAEMGEWLPDDVHIMRRNTSKGMFHVFGDDEDYVGCWGASAAEAIAHKLITVATSAWPSKYHPLACTLTPPETR
jgi:hypothetical protein